MGKFDALFGKFILLSILFLSIFSFIIVTQSDNNASDPAINNEVFNESLIGLQTQIDSTNEDAEEKYGVFSNENPKPGFGSIVLFGIVSFGKTMSNGLFSLFGAVVRFPLVILGIEPDLYSLLLTWLIIAVVVSVWLLYKLGG